MKKILALIVAALMLATGQASGGEWQHEYRQTVRRPHPHHDEWRHRHNRRGGDDNLAAGIIGLALGIVILGVAEEANKREHARAGTEVFPSAPKSPKDCFVLDGVKYCRTN